jgi:translocation and assembly module TamA
VISLPPPDRLSRKARPGGWRLAQRAKHGLWAGAALAALLLAASASAQQATLAAPGAPDALAKTLRGASLVLSTLAEGPVPASDVMAAARADYGRLVGALYAEGYYSGVISIRIDGREAAEIPVLDDPARISRIDITVQPGVPFRFSRAEVTPLAPGTELPPEFAVGQPAPSGVISDAVRAGIDGWRDVGYAKAEPAGQQIVADHAAATLDARITLAPGPRLRFGRLTVSGNARVRTDRIEEIAGLPEGETFSPDEMRRAADRLRRTGAFRSVSLREADEPGPGDLLPIAVLVDEEKPHRLGFGAELSSSEGLRLTGYWLHRNLFHGAERLRFDGEIAGIGGQTGGEDYRLGVSFARPATFTPDTSLTLDALAEQRFEPDYDIQGFEFGVGLAHVFSETLSGAVSLRYRQSRVEDASGTTDFSTLTLPISLTWDRRDDRLNPADGFYVEAEAMPFLGLDGTGSGARLTADARAYRGFGNGRFVAAARLQFGSIFGPDLADTPRDFLFYSGGGGTVRGQDYESLGVTALPGGIRSGGQHFLGLQAELRARVTEKIGVVAFYDWGYVAAQDWGDAYDGSHSGAGLGLRYDTGIGPIRLDVGVPVSGGGGAQIYIGIGQAF